MLGMELCTDAKCNPCVSSVKSIDNCPDAGQNRVLEVPRTHAYEKSYDFFGIHSVYQHIGMHDIYVPDLECIGCGETFDEAMGDLIVRMACELVRMESFGIPVPEPSSHDVVYEHGDIVLEDDPSGHGQPTSWKVVKVTTGNYNEVYANRPLLSDEERQELEKLARSC